MKKFSTAALILALGLSSADARLGQKRHATEDEFVNRWASSGGGWRAMTSVTAFANVFAQAGLITDSSSSFTAISTESGASWFSTQFFYSPEYFDAAINSSPDELSDFITEWMGSYLTLTESLGTNQQCDILAPFNGTGLETLKQYCDAFVYYDGDWAAFTSAMLQSASEAYGDDGLVSRTANSANRVRALSGTDLYVQTSLAANSRIRGIDHSTAVYLGPASSQQILSAAIGVQYSVTSNGSLYYSTISDEGIELEAYTETISNSFNFPVGFSEFGAFPAPDQPTLINVPRGTTPSGTFPVPFGGGDADVAQIAGASSAALGTTSPLNPSTLNQYLSVSQQKMKEQGGNKAVAAFNKAVDAFYNTTLFDGVSVCSQWPNDCGETDGRFLDGTYTDQPTMALNIGQYQTRENGDLSKTLRMIITENNYYSYGPEPVLAYFNTSFNSDVAPGDLLWPSPEEWPFPIAVLSPQIFEETLEASDIEAVTQPITGINVTTAVLSGTTIDNPAFKTKAGQKVEILLISLNSNIPTDIIGEIQIEEYTPRLAQMAFDIVESEELVDRVAAFMSSPN